MQGLTEVSPIPSADDLVTDLLRYLLDPSDKDRAFCAFASSDDVALLINNFGGVSNFELEALTRTTLKMLSRDWSINPKRTFAQPFETSLNAPGWSISLLNISSISSQTKIPTATIFALLDRDTTAPAWPRNGYAHTTAAEPTPTTLSSPNSTTTKPRTDSFNLNIGPRISPPKLTHALLTACTQTSATEPVLTKWDTQMGDGDCGEAVVSICTNIQALLTPATNNVCASHNGHLIPILDDLCDSIEDIGGSLAAILSIFLASFTSALKKRSHDKTQEQELVPLFATAAKEALGNLQEYTSARTGGRTVMDTLIPFVEVFSRSLSFGEAVAAAEMGARSTEGMKAKFGRATYVGGKEEGEVPMDPGAWAAAVFLRGLREGLEGGS